MSQEDGANDICLNLLYTWRLLCNSFLVMTCFLLRDSSILPKKDLHRSLQAAAIPVCNASMDLDEPNEWSSSHQVDAFSRSFHVSPINLGFSVACFWLLGSCYDTL